ncbi:MAG TPA: hypothetical protein VGC97_03630 [Pyrinomonadaceae bacterium]|jgi:hypothetical protein
MNTQLLKLIVAITGVIALIIGVLSNLLSNDIRTYLGDRGVKSSALFLVFILCIVIWVVLTFIPVFDTKDTEKTDLTQYNTNQASSNLSNTSTNSNKYNGNTKVTPIPTLTVTPTLVPTATPTAIPTATPTPQLTPQPTPTPIPIREIYIGKTCWSKNRYQGRQEPNEAPNNLTGYMLDKPSRGGPKVIVVDAIKGTDKNIWLQVKVDGDIVGWFKLYYFAECVK